ADIDEPAVCALAEQPVRGPGGGTAVLQKENVQAAVVVEVEERASRANDLRQEILAVHGTRIMREAEADLVGDLLKPDGPLGLLLVRRGRIRSVAAATTSQQQGAEPGCHDGLHGVDWWLVSSEW